MHSIISIIKGNNNKEEVSLYYNFLFGYKAKKIFIKIFPEFSLPYYN